MTAHALDELLAKLLPCHYVSTAPGARSWISCRVCAWMWPEGTESTHAPDCELAAYLAAQRPAAPVEGEMSARFAQGTRVLHRGMNEIGVVRQVDRDGTVHVVYERTSMNGANWTGSYDKNWFRICGDLLIEEPAT